MVDVFAEQIVEDLVSEIMKVMLETETKLWHRKLRDYCRKSCYICTNLNAEGGNGYEVFHLEK